MTTFAEAAKDWFRVADEYQEFGASDTEPRAEFALYIEGIVHAAEWGSEERPLPRTIDDWQLYHFEPGDTKPAAGTSGKAARELTKAANIAGKAARRDIASATSWLRGR